MKKISIIGISATGKTTLARELSHMYNVPIIYCDSLRWGENWMEQNEEDVVAQLKKVLQNDSWILEGYINPLAQQRLQKSDTVIYLDYPGYVTGISYIKRFLQHRTQKRAELPDGCHEKFSFNFLKNVICRDEKREIESEIQGFESKVIRLKSRKELKEYINMLKR